VNPNNPNRKSAIVEPSEKLSGVFGDPVDQKALAQINVVLGDDRAVRGALMADHHLGYSMPIGGVVAYQDAISPSGVGFDIACGNKAVRTNVLLAELGEVKPLMRKIQKSVAFGLGRRNEERVEHELFDSDVWRELGAPGMELREKAMAQLGTVGSGNHYVDILADDEGYVWIANHFGSRGMGHTIATWFLAVAAGGTIGDRIPESETPAVLDLGTAGGDLYLEAMQLAGQYAYAGRDYVIQQVLKILGSPKVTFEVHNHHNYAWKEDGLWVVRKGATPLTAAPAFIGGSMGDISVIVKGKGLTPVAGPKDSPWYVEDIGALGSAPHGAGRIMSRTAAAGKLRKMWYCGNSRECGMVPFRQTEPKPNPGNVCPNCGGVLRKARMRDVTSAAVDWDATRKDLAERGIVVLGSGADEAPQVYKNLRAVLKQHSNIDVMHTLYPQGVVMAGSDDFDPYRD
jgi:tRNA-splicing ligase RtcB